MHLHSSSFTDMSKKVIVIGGGIAGMTAAASLSETGVSVVLLEKEKQLGGHVRNWDRLFPSLRSGNEVLSYWENLVNSRVEVIPGVTISGIIQHNNEFTVLIENDRQITANAVVLATGYSLFDAGKKEEYGYGIYDNVITSADLESIFREGKKITTAGGNTPGRIGFVHCVGSRDEKVGNLYCSKVCCVTGVKQAIEIRKELPEAEVYGFYMDLRMYDRNFEELYFEAQQKWGINFIRGRVSECAENTDHSILLKTEDTLTGRPLRMSVDLLILLVGFIPSPGTMKLSTMLGLKHGPDGFLKPADEHLLDNTTDVPGLFLTGAVKGPYTIVNTIADARATALQVSSYLSYIG